MPQNNCISDQTLESYRQLGVHVMVMLEPGRFGLDQFISTISPPFVLGGRISGVSHTSDTRQFTLDVSIGLTARLVSLLRQYDSRIRGHWKKTDGGVLIPVDRELSRFGRSYGITEVSPVQEILKRYNQAIPPYLTCLEEA